MAPPEDGNQYLPFVDLMDIEKINQVTYRSKALPYSPNSYGRAYGGHVYAQAVWAAAQTVDKGFVIHNVTGWFILAGLTNVPFVYTVELIRNGKSYCTRIVNVTQADGQGICFTCTCSFKRAEDSPMDVQDTIDLWDEYAVVLKGTKEQDWPEAPGVDVPLYWKRMRETGINDAFPGLDRRKVEMGPYNDMRHPLSRRQLLFYRISGSLPADADPNLHACAHLYASDINSLYIVANHLDVGDKFTQAASISHTVVFHVPDHELLMQTPGENAKGGNEALWYCKEDWTSRAADGRGMHHGRLVGPGGRHVATTWQEGMVRLGKEATKEKEFVRFDKPGAERPRVKL
ncbi:Thioesterase/thiol ester dehydrase-isomerase [Myriangium duriaei CBS 260.36]|uniref:Thioesterase/thiol ester dehydrase-isomerase n=1 Tax=Myriangium duriaei CBS 260.36 TaxID=1168546 RepID=A0A9P4ISK4_9PEZI|nr:Thioesterase/thiol ester dehydrase-isomerase [Myriangium duriaei CBS 260.36]